MLKIAVVLAVVLSLFSCKRPGTDRDLNCERYGEMMLERKVECSGSVDGTKLTPDNAEEMAAKAKAACMSDKTLTPTAECTKQLKAAPCDGDMPKAAAMPACRAK